MVRPGSKTGSKRMICLSSVAGLREPGLRRTVAPGHPATDVTIAAYTCVVTK